MKVQEAIPALEAYAKDHAEVAGAWRSLARAKLVVRADEEALELVREGQSVLALDLSEEEGNRVAAELEIVAGDRYAFYE